MTYSCLIKSLKSIREQIRELIVNAHKTRTDYAEIQRSYDTCLHRFKLWFGEDIVIENTESRKKKCVITFDENKEHNPLYKIYKMHALSSSNSISSYFVLLDILRDRHLSKNEIMAEWESRYHDLEFYVNDASKRSKRKDISEAGILSDSTLTRCLKKYEREYGIIKVSKQKSKDLYALYQPSFDLERWRDALHFFSEVSPLGVIGDYLLNRLNRGDYTLLNQEMITSSLCKTTSPFVFDHIYCVYALDFEIVETLLEAIAACEPVRINNTKLSTIEKAEIVPLKLYISSRSGRQFVLGCHCDGSNLRVYRIDRIQEISIIRDRGTFECHRALIRVFEQNMWGVYVTEVKQTEHIEITFKIPEGSESVLQRLNSEKRCGKLEKLSDDRWGYQADVHSASEMMPWIRTYMGYICSVKSSHGKLESKFRTEMEELRKMYGLSK